MEWQPLLDGSLRGQALETIGDIAEALRHPVEQTPFEDHATETTQAIKLGLMTGRAGIAVFFAYLAEASLHIKTPKSSPGIFSRNPKPASRSTGWARHCARDSPVSPGLTLICIRHYRTRGIGVSSRISMKRFLALLRDWPSPDQYELFVWVGGHRCVMRSKGFPAPGSDDGATHPRAAGRIGPTHEGRYRVESATELKRAEEGEYNLGMAHGIPGVVAFLASREQLRRYSARRLSPSPEEHGQLGPPPASFRRTGWWVPAFMTPGRSRLRPGLPGVTATRVSQPRWSPQPGC